MIKIKMPKLFSFNNSKIRRVKIDSLKTNPKFKDLYIAEPEKVEALCKSILENGLDPTQPIIILEDGTVVDGHSRLLAAKKAGLDEVFVIVKKGFNSETEVLMYEEHLQLSRRNLSEAEKLKHLENLLQLKKEAQKEGKDISEYSDESIAQKLSISPRQVQKMREVESKATPQQLEAIRSGESTLNKVHEEIKKTQGPSRKISVTKKETEKEDYSNIYVSEVISLMKKHIPEIKIPESFTEDLKQYFKSKGGKHETK